MSLSHLEALFEYAVELNDEQREQFLDQLARDSQSMAAGLRQLLAADRDHETAPKLRWSGTAARLPPGAAVGSFIVSEWIASGGMADVYLAERPAGSATQRVALKLMKNEVDERLRSRMAFEQTALATLDHPGIAKLIEAGLIDGQPYVAMAFVDGKPIHQYADAHACSIHQRIGLALLVCDALAAAHASLIVHRDIKASNVLVADNGHVQIIDFGIAKSLDVDRDLRETSPTTRFFSPHYAAPEQWLGHARTIAVDVYGTGALLYELLSGATLFDFTNLSLGQMEQRVAEAIPKRLDVRFSELSEGQRTDIARNRGRNEKVLASELRSDDLNAILQKCLRKEPKDRYATINALAADLRAFLDGYPVIARRGSTAYRMRKYVQRNWKPLAGGVVASGLLLIGSTTVLQLENARRSESDRADAVGNVLLEAVRSADPSNTLGLKVTAAEILANAERLLSAQTNVPPNKRAEFLVSIASTYVQLGESERALAILDRTTVPGVEPSAEYLFAKAGAKHGLEALDEAKAILLSIPMLNETTAANAELELAKVEYSAGQYSEMRARLEKLKPNIPSHEVELLEDARYWQAAATSATNDFATAAQLLEALSADQKRRSADPLRIARTLQRLSTEYIRMGGNDKALPALSGAMELIGQVFGKRSFQYRTLESNMAFLLMGQEKVAEALPLIDSSLEAMEEWLGVNHRRTAMMTFNAAMLHEKSPTGPARALSLYRQAIDRAAMAFDENHPNRFLFHIAYAFFAFGSGEIETTLALCETASAIAEKNATVREWDLFPALQALHSAARWSQSALPEAERDVRRHFATLASLSAEGKVGPQTLEKAQGLQADLEKRGLQFSDSQKL